MLDPVNKAMSSLVSNSLRTRPDQDDHLSALGTALIRLWAVPFSLFVLSPAPRTLYHEVTRAKFNSKLENLHRTIAGIAVRRDPASIRLKDVAA